MPKTHPTRPVRWSRLLTMAGIVVGAILLLFVILDATDTFRFGSSVSSTTYATRAELTRNWNKSVAWLPNDATEIRVKEVKRYGPKWDPAILLALSDSSLNPTLCAQTKRLSSPVLTAPWSLNTNHGEVWVCGNWDAIPTTNGWFAWTVNSPQEQAAAAALLKIRPSAHK
jgi:hypothetical protein